MYNFNNIVRAYLNNHLSAKQNYPLLAQIESNKRFEKIRDSLDKIHQMELSNQKPEDESIKSYLIDTLDVVRATDPDDILKRYPVVEFKTNRVNLLGNGLSLSYFDNRQPDIYVYMIITNSIYHRIFSGYKTVLVVNTKQDESSQSDRDFVLLKFNKFSLQNFKSKSVIEELRDRK